MSVGAMPTLKSVFFLAIFLLCFAHGQRLRDSIYDSIFSGGACFKKLNGTHQIGCSSKRGGSVGVLHAVFGFQDIEWILNNGTAGPYVPILPLYLFKNDIVDRLITESDKIAGIIVINNGSNTPDNFSHDQRCPNQRSLWMTEGYCQNSQQDADVWNPVGTGLMWRDYPFAIFYIPPEKRDDIIKLYDCFNRFNAFELDVQTSRSLCAIEMDSFMYAAVNSEVCIRRSNNIKNLSPVRYCDPLSDLSMFTTLFPRESYFEKSSNYVKNSESDPVNMERKNFIEKNGSVALVTAAMDATSMFEAVGIGAETTLSGMVTLLVTIHALNAMFPLNETIEYDKNVMFVLLSGESYDYIGSQRMVWDLLANTFPYETSIPSPPLSPMAIGPHIHLGQLHGRADHLNAFVPIYEENERDDMISSFIKMMQNGDKTPIKIIKGNNLPPSSVHSFQRMLNSSVTQMGSAVLATHDKNFDNKYYQSILDDKNNLEYTYLNLSSKVEGGTLPDKLVPNDFIQTKLANIATSLAKALYQHVTNKSYTGSVNASAFLVDELLHCLLETLSCPLLSAASETPLPETQSPLPAPSLYVGVSWTSFPISSLANFISGVEVQKDKNNCKGSDIESLSYSWVPGWEGKGICIQSALNFTTAKSPAFLETDYDFTSGQYSTWTESVWRSISLRIFVKPPKRRENVTIGIGCTVFALSLIFVLVGRKHVIWLLKTINPDEDSDVSPQSRSRADC